MTLRYPVVVWPDAEGGYAGRLLDGPDVEAYDDSPAALLLQLKRYLHWLQRRTGLLEAEWDEWEPVEYAVQVRAEYLQDGVSFPVHPPLDLRVACMLGRRADGARLCVAPTLGLRLAFQPGDPIERLLGEAAGRALAGRTPQELSRRLTPAPLRLDAVHLRARPIAKDDDACGRSHLEAVADRMLRRRSGAAASRAVGRDELVAQVARRLSAEQANLLLVGKPGVGKSTVLADAVRLLARQRREARRRDPTDHRRPLVFWRTAGHRLVAGMQYLGQWEERCERIVEELAESNGVLCVEDLLELVRVGGRDPSGGVGAFLAPYLQRGELRMVAEATPDQLDACRRLLPALADRFEIVRVPEFAPDAARDVLQRLLAEGARNRRIELEPQVAEQVFRLFQRFLPYAAFPGRAAGFVRRWLTDAERDAASRLTPLDAVARFQRESGLPDELLRDDLPLQRDELLADFQTAVLGQDRACETAAQLLLTLKAGLNDPRRPLGVLLFCGPTGVGKTELAKALADRLFGAGAVQDRLIRLDMSEYSSYGAADRLLVAGDGEVSPFVRRVRRQPFCVVLFDEVEKAAPEVHDALLGLLDEGRLTDRYGRTTLFQSAVVVMTSNVGADRPQAVGWSDDARPAFERIAIETFRPEFFNRIDEVVTFEPLGETVIRKLARRELEALERREGLAKQRLTIEPTDALVNAVADAAYDPRYGARPLLRAVERMVVGPLARWLLSRPDLADRRIRLDWRDPDGLRCAELSLDE